MGTYLLSLDQGTTSSRAILFDREQNILGVAQKEFTQFYPREGWVEHDPMEVWSSQYGVMMEVIAQSGVNPAEIAAIGITNQRETTILWDRATGRPIYNAIVWQCRRTAELVDRLRADGLEEHIRAATGLVPDAYFSATKIKWVLDHVEGAREKARRGEILFGTVDAWLLWKLTGGAVHATDVTNASRTMLFDIHALDWDDTLLSSLDIPRAMLPQVRPSSEVYGYTDIQGVRIPIAGMAGDQQAALFGQGCFSPGDAKNTYGTGCFLLMNTGDKPCASRNGLLTTVAVGLDGGVQYALEGSVFVGGAVIQWLRDELRFFPESRDAEYYAQKVPDNGGRLSGTRLYRSGGPLLGHVRPGHSGGPHPGHPAGAHHPGGPGVHRLPGGRPGSRHGGGYRPAIGPAQGRRRGQPGRLPHAVPGGHPGSGGPPPRHPGDHRPGGSLSGRSGRRGVERYRRAAPPVAVRHRLLPRHAAGAAGAPAGAVAPGGGPQPGLGPVENRHIFLFFPLFTRLSYGQRWGKIEGTRQEALIMQNIDPYSYQCGVIDCFNEMVRSGVKALALSHPMDSAAERDALIPFARSCCHQYGNQLYIEDTPLLTDLFPLSLNQGKFNILFYRAGHILDQYLRLKERKANLVAERAYFGGNRSQLAWEYGRLLSYPDEAIRRLISDNPEKERL